MTAHVVLLRGVNVGGKNKVPMADLRRCLEEAGFVAVATYIASGNVVLESDLDPEAIRARIDQALHACFELDQLVRVAVLTRDRLRSVIDARPAGFGDDPATYHSDAVFLIDIEAGDAMRAFDPRDGVDRVWPGEGVVYSQRVSALRTKSRLSKVMATPQYASMTIRSWSTTLALADLVERREAERER